MSTSAWDRVCAPRTSCASAAVSPCASYGCILAVRPCGIGMQTSQLCTRTSYGEQVRCPSCPCVIRGDQTEQIATCVHTEMHTLGSIITCIRALLKLPPRRVETQLRAPMCMVKMRMCVCIFCVKYVLVSVWCWFIVVLCSWCVVFSWITYCCMFSLCVRVCMGLPSIAWRSRPGWSWRPRCRQGRKLRPRAKTDYPQSCPTP